MCYIHYAYGQYVVTLGTLESIYNAIINHHGAVADFKFGEVIVATVGRDG